MKGTTHVAAIALLILSAGTVAGQELDLHVSADSVTVGERFFVALTAHHEFATGPEFPSVDTIGALSFGDLEVLSLHTRQSSERAGVRIDSVVYEVTTFALDTARVAAIPVRFTAGEDTFTVLTDSAWLPVISTVPDDAEDVRDLAPLVEFPASRWPYVAAAAALLLLALLIALYLHRRRRAGEADTPPPPALPPEQEAMDRLTALERVDLSVAENVQPFYDELSGLLRTYVGRRLHVRAMESTTGELVRELQHRRTPPEAIIERLREVLTASDYVKFADATPPPSQGRELIITSRSIVHEVEHALTPPQQPSSADEAPSIQ